MSISFLKIEPRKNCYYFINNNSIIAGYSTLCVKENNEIEKYSNDWLYLINNGPDINEIKSFIINNKDKSQYIDEDVIPLITAFNTSVHCFVGIINILYSYFKNLTDYEKLKFVIYKNLQKGVLDIILFFCDSLEISKENLIFLDDNKIYKFKSVTIIPNTLHSYFENIEVRDNMCGFIETYILSKKAVLNSDKYNINCENKNIAIIKTYSNGITSTMGSVSDLKAVEISKIHNCSLVDIGMHNEIQIIQLIYNCENVIFSWGTTFMKNFIYISELCKNVTVIIIGDEFINEYNHLVKNNKLITKFKNANFHYKFS